jgi:hypothetical protein
MFQESNWIDCSRLDNKQEMSYGGNLKGFDRGERQLERSKSALLKAFSLLMKEKNYSEITINQIVEYLEYLQKK